MQRRKQHGFTLTEILVSLVILTSSFLALVEIAGKHTSNTIYLRDKTLAHWVAMNQMASLKVNKDFPNVGTTELTKAMASRDWFVLQEVKETNFDELRRIIISVKLDKNSTSALINITGFVRKPPKPSSQQNSNA